jgi:STE24 endopeptidase
MTTVAGSPTTEINPWKTFPSSPDDWYTADEMAKADAYGKPLRKVLLIGGAAAFLVDLVVVVTHAAPRMLDALGVTNWVVGLLVSVAVVQVVAMAVSTPFAAWRELGYDKRWGFSKQTTKGFVVDLVKSIPLGIVISALIFLPLYAVIRATDLWWLFGGIVFAVISITFGVLFPVVISPLFNKYTPLEEGPLRAAILDTARQAGADINEVLVEDSSKRDTRPNAYVAGIGKVRRVVLFDNMLRYPQEAIVSVIAHEIGHWKLRHIARIIPFAFAVTLASFAVLGALLSNDTVLGWAGVDHVGDPGSLPLFLLAFGALSKATSLASAWYSRARERQADLFSYDLLGSPSELRGFFHDVSVENLMDLRPTPWRRLKASHPPMSERMAMADAWSAAAHRAG